MMLTGRAAALIVSAGVGMAMAGGWGCGLATADATDNSASSADSSGSDSASSRQSSKPDRPDAAPDTTDTTDPADTADPADPADQEADDQAPDESADETEAEDVDDIDEPEPKPKRSARETRSGVIDRENKSSAPAGPVTTNSVATTVTTGETQPDDVGPAPDAPPSEDVADVTEVAVTDTDTAEVTAPQVQTDPDPVQRPAQGLTAIVSTLAAAVLNPLSAADDAPGAPADTPAEWALLAAARRELGVPVSANDNVAAAVTTSVAAEPPLPDDWESQYTGAPTLVHQLVVTGLRVVDAVLKPFGGLLAFTSLKVPLFTDGVPPFFFRHGLDVQRSEFDGMPVWTLQPEEPTDKVIVALHGGAYVAEASLFHWWTYTDMARDTGATVVVPLYQLVPDGGTAAIEVPKTADFIEQLIAEHGAENVSVIGDSAGGGLALAAVQELVVRGSAVPSRMVLFAPWLDAAVGDPLSAQLDPGDPLLDVPNLQEAGRDWAGELGTAHRFASPLYGSLDGLPPTAVYSGSLDLLTPDTLRLQQRVLEQGHDNFTFTLRRDLIHDWGIFAFLPDARAVRPSVYRDLLGEPVGL